jgi:hypothetical protein
MGGADGVDSTLGSCWGGALTLGAGAGAGTLGVAAGVGTLGVDVGSGGSCVTAGGCWSGETMARRLSMARSWSSVLVGERTDLIAAVRAHRQWMMQSSADKYGKLSV